ncbi:nitrilase-related carbon-nitrogen hydrolase [Endozoicomonas montiporae]|uniref:Putative amidohydrolase n=1 Tax=Endozoicomonas montiporae CL-33 TaxID=570277 RepID=A0A142B7E6_9GAMM|nr:nitrilase-related carbon-nitrogen hydrolase [Endozoicomonas montiporae]AMO54672.1 putative amidohydrolase [Endozoicomonas montiporae CL-33]
MQEVTIVSVQFNHRANDKFHNLNCIDAYAKQASEQGVDFLCFPEMCITAFRHLHNLKRRAIVRLAEQVPDGLACQHLQHLAQHYRINIGAGLIESDGDGKFYNTYILAMSDGRLERHRKSCTPGSEHMTTENGHHVFSTPVGCHTGILTCEEKSQAANVEATVQRGADIILVPHLNGKLIVLGAMLAKTSGTANTLEIAEFKVKL